ncbi:aminotransferase class V-fold PLP-dependent enzyme [Vibrio sp. ZSDZ34]|uniref:Aminotransferase class V-fold PLP-dependent enzyme n=1 Tax=Vibrio gelatinilyticus TaxID=2893468 RepID=A0A9X1WDA9_9VIBR|nr:aminotransferase class V-fold PLP-dependent enzyme [Vibrio gelatinilyticus]MCJ2377078.1 aminotransferase class V-fold PLP-dependent enzyme [Vibrio gelatinilyticus]
MKKQDQNKDVVSVNRRNFIKGGASVAIAGIGSTVFSAASVADELDNDWGISRYSSDEEFWDGVRSQFILDDSTTYMNIGTTGSMPKHVLKNYHKNNKTVAKYPWDMDNKFGSWPYVSDMVSDIAASFGAEPHEIILSRNTTDGMCSIINGLNLQPGDVILTTHHEHIAAVSPLNVVKERFGVEIVEIQLPVFTGSENVTERDYVKAFRKAIKEHSNVKLITFSHITYKTGTRLPAKKICQLATKHQIPTLVDGAHTIGMLDLNFHDIECDFYAGSGHKWQCGPGATGILYVRDNMNRLKEWSNGEKPYWAINSSLGHLDFFGSQLQLQYIGNDNYPAKQALVDSCKMWDDIGRARIEKRVLELGSLCKDLLQEALPNAYIFSPNEKGLTSGLTTFNPFELEDKELLTQFRDRLREDYGYIIRTTDFKLYKDDTADSNALRISTHLFHNEEDVRGLVSAIRDLYDYMA